MTVSRISARLLPGFAFAWLATATQAQEPGPPTPLDPRILVPREDIPPAPSDTAPPVPQDNATEPPAPQIPAPENPAPAEEPTQSIVAPPAPVTIGDLGTLEGPVAGTLDEAAGGLGYAEWDGSERGAVEGILQHLRAATPSATARLLLRKILLTPAPPPLGRGSETFAGLRLRKLLEGGFVDDAADLAANVQSRDPATQRLQADALLFAGRDDMACGDTTAQRLDSAESFWVELRAYCYAVAGDDGPLELTRTVMEQQGIADPTFVTLLDSLSNPTQPAPETFYNTSSLLLRLLVRLDLPIPESVVQDLGLPADLIAAASSQTDKAVRLAAAERALRAGALSTNVLRQVLDLIAFKPQDLIGAAALAPQEPLMTGLARLRAALKVQRQPATRAGLVATALTIGEEQGILPQVADLFGDEASALDPAPDWDNWASLMARGLLLAGKDTDAVRWAALLDSGVLAQSDTANRLRVLFALAQPTQARLAQVQDTLAAMAVASQATDVAPPALANAALALGLFEATGRDMPDNARAQAMALVQLKYPGRRPAPVAIQRIDAAALANRKGEVALGVADALGQRGAADLPPDVVVRLVRALKTAGINDAARALILEALLTRPDS